MGQTILFGGVKTCFIIPPKQKDPAFQQLFVLEREQDQGHFCFMDLLSKVIKILSVTLVPTSLKDQRTYDGSLIKHKYFL